MSSPRAGLGTQGNGLYITSGLSNISGRRYTRDRTAPHGHVQSMSKAASWGNCFARQHAQYAPLT